MYALQIWESRMRGQAPRFVIAETLKTAINVLRLFLFYDRELLATCAR